MYRPLTCLLLQKSAADSTQDLHVLTECNRAIMATALGEDLLDTYKQYGVIQNPQVKVRSFAHHTNPSY